MAASGLGLAASAQEDCLYCLGPAETPREGFEWAIRIRTEDGETPGPSGWSAFQPTAMDALRTAMRAMPRGLSVEGSIRHKFYDFGAGESAWAQREVFRAYLDPAGSVRFERVSV
ncbi:hypothetical protein [Nonomuraea pusilla]|uniref:Uncharacterized protein n=1 Tax=Nonomuraea pusilla TaxID=46177 RepID=A0A1H7RC83_9ACTN|nr:hypothetical protein [Nonomuraea pusilla]SEL57598.1 hypothetical protein SAMN05660976_02877 [Nonomuraea pusilla]